MSLLKYTQFSRPQTITESEMILRERVSDDSRVVLWSKCVLFPKNTTLKRPQLIKSLTRVILVSVIQRIYSTRETQDVSTCFIFYMIRSFLSQQHVYN